ncbi:DUF3667 domain-containing protein [Emticicia sp. CRIBPO]|uniref:DUF3667 domain-containing protein n=1 Tax=Emticicia sp. CRIBPO TaxID=2683258 RepID=UPI001412572A|nr:DUF3667 domain-containing protein [Emticicia sp. CRIBPO]NBA85525.1 DUF3667 domain-containing protein [Emticicia sp. CRIBPO]
MEANCLNCGNEVSQKYCGHCGQTSSTHRYSLKHFITHDFIHGVWHVDKGILYTLKELFVNPGNSVRGYVLGKRVGYFNFITLILLVLGISGLLGPYTHIKLADLMSESSKKTVSELEAFASHYPKLVLLITIPITSLFSLFWFRKAKFNYAEHLVLNSYKAAVEMIVSLVFTVITIFYTNLKGLLLIYYLGIEVFVFVYTIWFYYQFFSKSGYSKKALLIRSFMVPASIMFLSVVVGIIMGVLNHLPH